MWGFVWRSRAVSVIFVASMAASSAYSATVELTSVTGSFTNPLWNVDFHNLSENTEAQLAADPRNQGEGLIRDDVAGELWWGNPRPVGSEAKPWNNFDPLSGDLLAMQSGYVFEGIKPPSVFSSSDASFVFGKFTHHNGAVWTNSATLASVDFQIDIEGRIVKGEESEAFSLSTMFSLIHQETINPATPCAAQGEIPCRDSVTIMGEISETLPFVVGDIEYTFVLKGLVKSLEGPGVTSFFTEETQQNSAMLRGRIEWAELPPPVIPLPAAGWLMIAGLGGLAAMARKKRRAA
jgi:hypothetical protein